MTDRPSAPQPVADLVQRLRERGDALRCHPVANGSIDRIEAAGELLVEAAAALDAAVAAAVAQERERLAHAAETMAQEADSKFPMDGTVAHWLRSLVSKRSF